MKKRLARNREPNMHPTREADITEKLQISREKVEPVKHRFVQSEHKHGVNEKHSKKQKKTVLEALKSTLPSKP